jgi:hypothetical protein
MTQSFLRKRLCDSRFFAAEKMLSARTPSLPNHERFGNDKKIWCDGEMSMIPRRWRTKPFEITALERRRDTSPPVDEGIAER